MNKSKNIVLSVIGLILFVAGLLAMVFFDLDGRTAPYLCIGLGCGVFGQGLGDLIACRNEKRNPEVARQREIEENDERNIALRDKAQAKAYRMMIPVFGVLFLVFALMKVEFKVILLLVAAYLFICGCSIYYNIKYSKEM